MVVVVGVAVHPNPLCLVRVGFARFLCRFFLLKRVLAGSAGSPQRRIHSNGGQGAARQQSTTKQTPKPTSRQQTTRPTPLCCHSRSPDSDLNHLISATEPAAAHTPPPCRSYPPHLWPPP